MLLLKIQNWMKYTFEIIKLCDIKSEKNLTSHLLKINVFVVMDVIKSFIKKKLQ